MDVDIRHYDDGTLRRIEITNDKGELHNENGPAYQVWYSSGQEQYRAYFINGRQHNDSGPASQYWYSNGQEKYRVYYINDKWHNENGPARQYWLKSGKEDHSDYYINGMRLSEEEFNHRENNTVEITVEGNTKPITSITKGDLMRLFTESGIEFYREAQCEFCGNTWRETFELKGCDTEKGE